MRDLMPFLDWLLFAAACLFTGWLFHAIQNAAQAIKMGAI
jgi:hypothetical protein